MPRTRDFRIPATDAVSGADDGAPDRFTSVLTRVRESWIPALDVVGDGLRVIPARPGESCIVGRTGARVVYLADDEAGRGRVRLERARLEWARARGIPVPRVIDGADDGSWLVTERVPSDAPRGGPFVAAALDAARSISEAGAPPPEILEGSRSRRASKLTLPLRWSRLMRHALGVREFVAARREALRLPTTTLAHGDFLPGNLAYDRRAGAVLITDLECLTRAPARFDELTLWCGLEEKEDRRLVVDRLLAGSTPEERARLAVIHHWLAVRTLADVVTVPARFRNPAEVRLAKQRLTEARAHVADWTA